MEASGNTARVSVYIDDFRVEGCVHVGPRAGGNKGRVSDALNDEAGFVVLTEATIYETSFGEGKKEPRHYETIILGKGRIKFVIPLE